MKFAWSHVRRYKTDYKWARKKKV